MQIIETENYIIRPLDPSIAVVETREGVVLDGGKAREFYRLIQEHFAGDYSLIIHRKHRYRLLRFEVYKEANRCPRLKSLAIVADRPTTLKMAKMEETLAEKPFAIFSSVEDAVGWAQTFHPHSAQGAREPVA